MSHVPTFFGFVTDEGKLTLDHPSQFKAYAKKFAGNEVVVTVEKKSEAKTRLQEKGFHAMVQPWARDEGHRIDDLKRDLLAAVFGTREVTSPITGDVRVELNEPHTSTLTKAQYSELIERTLEIAAECGIVLEAPSEYTERKKKEARAAAKRQGRAA